MSNSQITVRVPDSVKVLWKEMADLDGRSMSNYLERLLLREKDLMDHGSETLETLGIKLNDIIDIISENKKRPVRQNGAKEKKETAYDAWEDVGVCTKESWDRWIDHLHKMNVHPNCYEAKIRYFNELCKFSKERWDCDHLIEYIIERGHRKLYVPKEWIEEERLR